MLSGEELSRLAAALGGLPILGCRAGSPAAVVGIRYGDILLSVNGIPTPDWGSYLEARGSGGLMTVVIFRNGVEQTYELVLEQREPVDVRALLAELITDRVLPPFVSTHSEPEPS